MIHATIRMKMPGQKVREAIENLSSFAEWTRVQPGCISSRIYRDVKENRVIMIEEYWMTQEDLKRHLCSAEWEVSCNFLGKDPTNLISRLAGLKFAAVPTKKMIRHQG